MPGIDHSVTSNSKLPNIYSPFDTVFILFYLICYLITTKTQYKRERGINMCKYCNYAFTDGWTDLLEYDRTYQTAMDQLRAERSNYGFSEGFDELQDDLAV